MRLLPPGKRVYKFVALPSREELKVFLNFAGPIAFALLGKVKSTSSLVYDGHFFLLVAVVVVACWMAATVEPQVGRNTPTLVVL